MAFLEHVVLQNFTNSLLFFFFPPNQDMFQNVGISCETEVPVLP